MLIKAYLFILDIPVPTSNAVDKATNKPGIPKIENKDIILMVLKLVKRISIVDNSGTGPSGAHETPKFWSMKKPADVVSIIRMPDKITCLIGIPLICVFYDEIQN
ncbi:hypothetical protein [Candidatus Pyrohabitans sp.]